MGASSSTSQGSGEAEFGGSRTLQQLADTLVFEVDEQTGEFRIISRSLEPGVASGGEGQERRGGGGEGRRVTEEGGREREEGGGGGRLPVIDEGCEEGMDEGNEDQACAEGGREAEEEDSEDTDTDVDGDISSSRLSTLRLLARLFGGRSAVPYVTSCGLWSCVA